MAVRSITGGQVIKLRALFKDDLGNDAQASNVYVHIFEPDADETDLTEAVTVSGTPEYLGQGIFEYEYTVPDIGPEGVWNDVWEGVLNGQNLEAILEFTVETSGIIETFSSQLFENDIVQITLESGLEATDGTFLSEEFNAEFMTTTNPNYTSTRKVRLEVGAYIANIPDMILQMSILEASLEADILNFNTVLTNSALFKHARREYVTCAASKGLLTNVGNLLLRSKTLADLSVTYDTNGVRDATMALDNCMDKWIPQLISGGGSRSNASPQYVVKGSRDPDRPYVNRSWQTTKGGNDRTPAANNSVRQGNERRYKRTYLPKAGKKYW